MRRRSLLQALAALPGLALLRDRRPRLDPPRETWYASGYKFSTVRLPDVAAGAVEVEARDREAVLVLAGGSRWKLTPGEVGRFYTGRSGWERAS